MKTIAVFEARNRLSELLTAVEQGEEVTITRRGAPVARIVSVNAASRTDADQRARVSGALARLRALRRGTSLGASVSAAIADGRD